jgi:hypothetical protein
MNLLSTSFDSMADSMGPMRNGMAGSVGTSDIA